MPGFTKGLGNIRRWQTVMTDQPMGFVCSNRISMFVMKTQRGWVKSKVLKRGDCSKIELNTGWAIVDAEDADKVRKFSWNISKTTGYAYSYKARTSMQQFLIGRAPEGMVIDHINRDTLDNRKANLRFTTYSVNRKNSSRWEQEKGYAFHKDSGKYQAYMHEGKKQVYLGLYLTKEDAQKARSAALMRVGKKDEQLKREE